MATCPFLRLPQELRDLIFEYALSEDRIENETAASLTHRIKRQSTGNERWEWNVYYDSAAPTAAYLSLMLCNRQLRKEVQQFLGGSDDQPPPSKTTVVIAYPIVTTVWTHVPRPPDKTTILDILLKIDHIYHPVFISHGAHNAILTTVFGLLKRYIHRGPHLARPSPLPRPLELDTVQITLAPPVPFEEMTYVYGFPAQQLETLFNDFKRLICRLARSGIPFGSIGAFDLRLEGKEWHRIPATSNIWDEDDYTFFQNVGFNWDAEE